MLNCTIDGKPNPIDDTNFSKPLPFVGLYISLATLYFIMTMLADLINGIRIKQYWIPNRYFSLNAASITILGVAIKLSLDFNTPMPSKLDQLAKLGASNFLCIVLANLLLCLPKLEKNQLRANTIALAIVIITSAVNLCIQLRTNVIYVSKSGHICSIVTLFSMLTQMTFFTFLTEGCRNLTELLYETLHKKARGKLSEGRDTQNFATQNLREYLREFTVMAYSGCPHFRLARCKVCCLFTWLFSWFPALVSLIEVISTYNHFEPASCGDESDYGWSVFGIFITQAIAMGVGLLIPFLRLVYLWMAGGLSSPITNGYGECNEYMLSSGFIPFTSYIKYRHLKTCKIYLSRDYYKFLISAPLWGTVNVILSKLTPLVSGISGSNNHTASTSRSDQNSGLRSYVIHLRSESHLVEMMMVSASNAFQKYINVGKREPKHLVELLDNYLSRDFGGVLTFDSDDVHPLDPQGSHPNCWTLPVVTLTSIAIALPNVDPNSIDRLIRGVNEGFLYVNLIEDNFSVRKGLINIKAAASITWAGVELRRRWLNVDLTKLAVQNRSPIEVIKLLSQSAEENFSNSMKEDIFSIPKVTKAVAAHSMHKICQTLLQEYQNENDHDRLSERMFAKVRINITDILGACFTNLKRWILHECSRSSPEKRREAAYRIVKIFGETEKIMEIVEQLEIPSLSPDQMGFIDEWRALHCPV